MSEQPLLEIHDLHCERGDRELFTGLCMQARAGEIWQISGPNGAGKTTLLRILAGLHGWFEGRVDWRLTPEQPRQDILFIGHTPGLRDELSATENLAWLCALHGQPAPDWRTLLRTVGLEGREQVPLAHLSAGQKRRVALARLWLEGKKVWILDEPFTAIDASGVNQVEQKLHQHARQGGLVLYTSHHRLAGDVSHLRLGEGIAEVVG